MTEYKRFLWVAMMVTGTCVFGVLIISILNKENMKGLMTSFSITTVLFIPAAMIVTKYKLYLPKEQKNQFTSLICSITFGVGLLIVPKMGSSIKEILSVFGFEMATLFYVLVRRLDKVSSRFSSS